MEVFFKSITFPQWREAWSQVYKTEPEYSPELFEGLHQMSLKSRSWGRIQYVGPEFYERTLLMPLAMIVDGKEVGWTCPFNSSDTSLRLRGTYILPEYRGKGLGQRLIEQALSQWPEPWSQCWVEVFENRQGFYEKCGFRVVQEMKPRSAFYEGVRLEELKRLPRSVMMVKDLRGEAVRVELSTFEEVLPLWRDQLWPGRTSEIRPLSSINSKGGIDMSILNSAPVFFVAKQGKNIVGVVSGFQTDSEEFRSRGLWVKDDHRNHGIAGKMMRALEAHAIGLECKSLWSMPRGSAIGFYLKYGFQIIGETDKYEFGPHYLVSKKLEVKRGPQ